MSAFLIVLVLENDQTKFKNTRDPLWSLRFLQDPQAGSSGVFGDPSSSKPSEFLQDPQGSSIMTNWDCGASLIMLENLGIRELCNGYFGICSLFVFILVPPPLPLFSSEIKAQEAHWQAGEHLKKHQKIIKCNVSKSEWFDLSLFSIK